MTDDLQQDVIREAAHAVRVAAAQRTLQGTATSEDRMLLAIDSALREHSAEEIKVLQSLPELVIQEFCKHFGSDNTLKGRIRKHGPALSVGGGLTAVVLELIRYLVHFGSKVP